jgi:hypothetical protein
LVGGINRLRPFLVVSSHVFVVLSAVTEFLVSGINRLRPFLVVSSHLFVVLGAVTEFWLAASTACGHFWSFLPISLSFSVQQHDSQGLRILYIISVHIGWDVTALVFISESGV